MKKTILLAFVIFSLKTYAQPAAKIRAIDSLVKKIKSSNFKIQRDSIKQEQPQLGISNLTYLTMESDGNELKKYVNEFHASTVDKNGLSKSLDGENAFYFDHNKLIKVEEFMMDGNEKVELGWYYDDDKPIYNTLKPGNYKDREEMLLTMAKNLIAQFKKTIPQPNN